jgi:hypothetical protein
MSENSTPSTERKLLSQHLDDLRRSGITEATARAVGLYSVDDPAEVARLLGWGRPAVELGPCMVFLYFEPDGSPMMYRRADGTLGQVLRLKPDHPRLDPARNNRPVKYEQPLGCPNRLYIPLGTDPAALRSASPSGSASAPPGAPAAGQAPPEAPANRRGRPRRTATSPRQLLVVEGEKKALRLYQEGLLVVAIGGTWNWTTRPPDDAEARQPGQLRELIADLCNLELAGRDVYLCFDSDAHINAQRHQPVEELARALAARGARVFDVVLPHLPGMEKTGPDDYLMAVGLPGLLALVNQAREIRQRPQYQGAGGADNLYEVRAGATYWLHHTANGPVPVRLCNFSAAIVGEILRDDGQEQTLQFELEGRLETGEALPRVRVLTDDFDAMHWPLRIWGGRPNISAGHGARDHLRSAIQTLSGDYTRRVVHMNTGWAPIRGQVGDQHRERFAFLHAGGAIGAEGVEVNLDAPLDKFRLPEPPTGEALVKAVRASLNLLNLAPDRVSFPGVAAVFRAILGQVDFSLHISGKSGIYKTEYAALLQRHFGVELGVGNLPAAWTSTANSLESTAFLLKDVVMLVDDYAPGEGRVDLQKMQQAADRLFRGVGNRSGRGRCRTDGSLRLPRFPRALVISTGEDLPPGHSLRARFLPLPLVEGDITSAKLSACQRDADEGLFAGTAAGFIAWLQPQYGTINLKDAIAKLRPELSTGQHARTPTLVANLTLGLEYLLRFALEVGAIDEARAEELRRRGAAGFDVAVAEQTEGLQEADPAIRFVSLLEACLASGAAYLENPNGGPPENPHTWGWTSGGQPRPGARMVGWLDGPDVYLQPEAALAVVQQLAHAHNSLIPVGESTLWKRLKEGGYLASWDSTRKRNKVRKDIGGVRGRYILHLHTATLHPAEGMEDDAEDVNDDIPGDDSEGNNQAEINSSPAPARDSLMVGVATSVRPTISPEPTTLVQENVGVNETDHRGRSGPDHRQTGQTGHTGAFGLVAGLAASAEVSGKRATEADGASPTSYPGCNSDTPNMGGLTGVATPNIRDGQGGGGERKNNSIEGPPEPVVEVREVGDEDAI